MSNLFARPLQQFSIALIVSMALATVVTVVLLAGAWLFYDAERKRGRDDLKRELTISAEQLAVAVALPAWNFDDSQVVAIMESGLNNRNLHGSMVMISPSLRRFILAKDASGRLASVAAAPAQPGLLSEKRPIIVAGDVIGEVTVYATPVFLLADLRTRRIVIFGVILALDAILVLSVYLLLWYLMLKPIRALGQYAATVKAGNSVGASPGKAWFFGELKTLNASIHEMVALLDSRYRAMRASEERLSIATSAAHIGIWDWDVARNELIWDEQMFRLFGVEKDVFENNYESWAATLMPEDLARATGEIEAAVRGEREYSAEFRIVWPDGTVRHIRAQAQTFRDERKRALRMVGVNYDITERKQAEQELLQHRGHLEELVGERTAALSIAVEEAKAASRAKSVFLSTMSHELRTPLNSVIGFSHLMSSSSTMLPEERHNLKIINRSGQHLLTLINDILELSKIEAGGGSLHCDTVNLNELVREVMDMVSTRARQHGLTMTLDCAGMPSAAKVDNAKLRQVLLNLMSNAVKFVERGGVTLEVRGRPTGAGRHLLTFAVRDTGIGIAMDDQARIFEPFVQADGSGPKEGTGLGLTISRQFVSMMGGTLEVQSQPGVGSAFYFTIEVEEAILVPQAVSDERVLAVDQHGKRILVVDDSEDGRKLLVSMLAPLGFVMCEVADGTAALEAVGQGRFDLVLMDWRMPGLDGLEVTRRVRADGTLSQPRIVIVTASAFEEEKQEALRAGADDFLRKPVESDRLFLVLEQQLHLTFQRGPAEPATIQGDPVSAPELRQLPVETRHALRSALQQLDMTMVFQTMTPLRNDQKRLAEAIEHMLSRHQYRQLCDMLDAIEDELR